MTGISRRIVTKKGVVTMTEGINALKRPERAVFSPDLERYAR
jgi:hypothetical protein